MINFQCAPLHFVSPSECLLTSSVPIGLPLTSGVAIRMPLTSHIPIRMPPLIECPHQSGPILFSTRQAEGGSWEVDQAASLGKGHYAHEMLGAGHAGDVIGLLGCQWS